MRQFVSENFPDKNGILTVTGKNFRYFKQVLRMKVGDMTNVRLPDGTLIETTVCKIDENSKKILLQLCGTGSSENRISENRNSENSASKEELSVSTGNGFSITLFQFVPKSSKMDLIVRQATECGVCRIVPVKGDFSQKFEKDYRNDRLNRIIKEARQQSGSPVATEIFNAMTVDEAVTFWKENSKSAATTESAFNAFVLYERGENTISMVEALGKYVSGEIALVVGGEGGISPAEIEKFKNNGFKIVHFDTNILRCETAALYGIASLQTLITEKNKWQLKE